MYLFRHHRFDEKDGFAGVQLDGREVAQPPREQELLLELHSDGTLILGLRHTLATGKPPRHERPQLLSAVLGEHAQLVVNGRHTSYSGQWYRRATYNVIKIDSFAPDCSERASPTRAVRSRPICFERPALWPSALPITFPIRDADRFGLVISSPAGRIDPKT